jgi:TPR repeat protein
MARIHSIIAALLLAASLHANADDSMMTLYQQVERSAQQGNPEMQYHLGMLLNNGIGVTKDPKQAYVWFERAAKAGDPLAAYKVGCYLAGQFAGVVPLDKEQALKYKLLSAEAGYALAQFDVGVLYYQDKAPEKGAPWWLAAARQGYPMALFNLAAAHQSGQGVPVDKVLAYSYLTLALQTPNAPANPSARARIVEIKASLSAEELAKADAIVAGWKRVPTALTLLAAQGIGRTKLLAEQIALGK